MGLVITPESELGKELAKWNKPHNPNDAKNQFPRMLYKAQRRPDGVMSYGEVSDAVFGNQPGAAEAFTRSCQMTVGSEGEMAKYLELGWRKTPQDAVERLKAKEETISTAAAHRAYEDRNMSEAAKAEAQAAEDATPEHVAEVPEKRRVRRTA